MRRVCEQIRNDESLINVEKAIASVNDIFNLQNADELMEAEKRYLPTPKEE
jgi:phosphoenolpyruvate phosphomutase